MDHTGQDLDIYGVLLAAVVVRLAVEAMVAIVTVS